MSEVLVAGSGVAEERWRSVRALEERVAEICGSLNVLHARLVETVAEVLACGAWQGVGVVSPEHWVAVHTGMSAWRSREVVRMARRRSVLPETFERFVVGAVSVDQMAVVAARVPAHQDVDAAVLAPVCTVEQLRSVFARRPVQPVVRGAHDQPDDADADASGDAGGGGLGPVEPWLSVGRDDAGNVSVHGVIAVPDGAVVERALREARDALFQAGNVQASYADALVEACERSLVSVPVGSRRDLYRVYVHLDTEGGFVHQGPPLPPSMLASLLCDATLQPVWTTAGIPVNVGRRQHVVPAHTRRMVEHRDRHCRYPTCASAHGLQVHHIIHWAPPANGPTDTWNLLVLCRRHHREHHRGGFAIAGNADVADGVTFTDQRGRTIRGARAPTPPNGPPPGPVRPYEHPPGERLQRKWIDLQPQPPPDTNAA